MSSLIRSPSTPQHWKEIERICIENAQNYSALVADPARARRFVKYWVEPYQEHFPRFALIAQSNGNVLGYLLFCPSTKQALSISPVFSETAKHIKDDPPDLFLAQYPAHLHINVTKASQGKGIGSTLLNTCLSAHQNNGIHLCCLPKVARFYESLGFRKSSRAKSADVSLLTWDPPLNILNP